MRRHVILGLFALALPHAQGAIPGSDTMRFRGACDASAACALDAETVAIADDENNILRVYSLAEPGMPLGEFPMGRFLKTNVDKHPEADFEACTRVGDRIYWIASHGRSKKGKWRPNRYLFFATKVTRAADGGYQLVPDGKPSRSLLEVLLVQPDLDLRRVVGKVGADAAGSLAPKDSGLNIEGLTASPDGETLYIGFRNPRPQGRAIILPLKNAAAVIEEGALPLFGEPMRIDLGGRGVRSMEYSAQHGKYFIAAGAHDNARISALYSWGGKPDGAPVKLRDFGAFNLEAIAPLPGSKRLQLFSDDGTVMVKASARETSDDLDVNGECECKSLIDPRKKGFRGMVMEVE